MMMDIDGRGGRTGRGWDAIRTEAASEERERTTAATQDITLRCRRHRVLRDDDRRRCAFPQRDRRFGAPGQPLTEHTADTGDRRRRCSDRRRSGGRSGRGDGAASDFGVPVVFRSSGPTRIVGLTTGGSTQTKGRVVTIFFFDLVETRVWFQWVS